jgi:putative ABC transport system substrate-binding protein
LGYLGSVDPAATPFHGAFRDAMRELGYVERKNLQIEHRWWSAGELASHPTLAAELVRLKSDAILTFGTPATLAAQRATALVPIVMVGAGDPLGLRLVDSLERPGGNVTGVSNFARDLSAKRLELLTQLVPGGKRFALLRNPANVLAALQLPELESAAKTLGMQVRAYDARNVGEIDAAFAQMQKDGVDGLIVFSDPMFLGLRSALAADARRYKLPSMSSNGHYVEAGGLISYGVDTTEMWRNAANFVDKIFKGASPTDLPVQQPRRFELAINRNAAQAFGLVVPQELLLRADKLFD